MPESSLLAPHLFPIYIIYIHVAIKYSEEYHFAGDINVWKFNICVNFINKQIKFDLKNLASWLNENKISFNGRKIVLVLFATRKKQLDGDLIFKLNGKRLYEADSVKYLGAHIAKIWHGNKRLIKLLIR